MDITTIDVASYATRVAQVAAAELYGLLNAPDDGSAWQAPANWFHPSTDLAADGALTIINERIEQLGQYVVANQVEQGERLYRWAGSRGLLPMGDWAQLDFAGRQAFEIFVDTCRHTYGGLAVAQKALEAARAAAGVRPVKVAIEDTIFEEEESIWAMHPEALAAGPLMARYDREQEAAAAQAAAEKAAQDEAARAEQERLADLAAAQAQVAEKRAQRKKPKPEPVSAGETVAAHQPNRGGRGKTNA
jgi:hypothetical protein